MLIQLCERLGAHPSSSTRMDEEPSVTKMLVNREESNKTVSQSSFFFRDCISNVCPTMAERS